MRLQTFLCALAILVFLLLASSARLRAEVTFAMGTVTAAPGETHATLPLSIELEPGSPPIQGWSAAVRYDPSVLRKVTLESTRPVDFFFYRGAETFAEPGTIGAAVIYSFTDDEERLISEASDGEVAVLMVCVDGDAPPGTYPIELVATGEGGAGWPPVRLQYTADGQAFDPGALAGSVTIAGDPVPAGECPPDPEDVPGQPPGGEDDPAVFVLGAGTAAPGQNDAVLPLSIELEPGSPPIQGWSAAVRYAPSVLRKVTLESTRPVDFFFYRGAETFAEPGTIGAAVIYSFTDDEERLISEASDGEVAVLMVCVKDDAPPGTYPIELVATGEGGAGWPPVRLQYTADGQTFDPGALAGSVTIAGDPVPAGECPPDPEDFAHVPGPVPPDKPLEATFKLLGGVAAPRASVAVPFIVRSRIEMQGFAISVDFDEDVLEATAVERVYEKPDGTDWGFHVFEFDNTRSTPGNAGVDEGFIVGAGVFDLEQAGPEVLPPRDADNEILALHFNVRPLAPAGDTYLSFLDGARAPSGSEPFANQLTLGDHSAIPRIEVAPIRVDAILRIIPEISIFIRGDANVDGEVDLSDAQTSLGYLYRGTEPPACFDAADANDDGTLDISDPISTLQFLYLGGDALPPPRGIPGPDGTSDPLGCLVSLSG